MNILATVLQILLVCVLIVIAYLAGEGDGRGAAMQALDPDEVIPIIKELTEDEDVQVVCVKLMLRILGRVREA